MAARKAKPLTLRDAQRAELYTALARTLSAGLDAVQALNAAQGIANGSLDAPIARARQLVTNGTDLLRALDHNGLVSPNDRPLLSAAQSNGALEQACDQLAERYQRADVRWRQMKGRMLMPALVLVIAIIVLPLPALMADRITVLDWALRATASLMLLALLAKLAAMAVMHWRANGTPGWLTRVARALPVSGPLSHLHQRADACERLALALRCGSPADDALNMMIRNEHNAVRRTALTRTRRKLSGGTPLADALQHASLVDAAGFAIVSTGEGAGRLDESLARVAANEHAILDGRYAVLAQWIPVLFYAGVAGTVAWGLIF